MMRSILGSMDILFWGGVCIAVYRVRASKVLCNLRDLIIFHSKLRCVVIYLFGWKNKVISLCEFEVNLQTLFDYGCFTTL